MKAKCADCGTIRDTRKMYLGRNIVESVLFIAGVVVGVHLL